MADVSGARVISGEREISREMLLGRALRAAGGFAALGVGPGDTVALVLRNDFPFFEASYAAQMLGAYCVPVNWHGKAPEIGYVLRDCGAKVVVAHADLLPQVLPELSEDTPLLTVMTPPEIAAAYALQPQQCRAPADGMTWNEWLAAHEPLANPGSGALSSMIYTSGTTGHPKGVRRLNLGAEFAAMVAELARVGFGFDPERPLRTVISGP
ncbi:MAG: AMP-binding protein, partial [Alphaproteobacteria bacterium]|nr:AMP-binding protein [Alphaproteobacteria bacterium]